ncbi:iron-containing redox enzyme family protein [uncultured Aquabacterium sp.]|uniref:iron-containing redox enzyme family protein n=1 Tax=uncultured Aquabacterium sp. TaxID=158753 RepID=UPI0030D54FAF|tara:strand:- start:1766 stop:2635 length:870 start_codon:yes stop_codon:yes gene_type:complete
MKAALPSPQAGLYEFNRGRLRNPSREAGPSLDFEGAWILDRLGGMPCPSVEPGLQGLLAGLNKLILEEAEQASESSDYVAQRMTRDEFKILVQEFSVDGLTEAQVFYYILPRLSLEAQMPMLRIMIDEFGSGNLQCAHTTLYVNLLNELGMPLDLAYYCSRIESTSFEFVNLFFWLTLRADDPSYFAGAITYLESVIPSFFACYVQACERLNIASHAYYSEHRHIDVFHAVEGRRLLRAMAADQTLDANKAWKGIHLAAQITGGAFEAAVVKARQSSQLGILSRDEVLR